MKEDKASQLTGHQATNGVLLIYWTAVWILGSWQAWHLSQTSPL